MEKDTIGSRVVALRARWGLSQGDLARLTGLYTQNISRLETATSEIGVQSHTLLLLARALDCSTDYLLGLTEYSTPAKDRRSARRSHKAKEHMT